MVSAALSVTFPAARNGGKLAREVAPALFGAHIAFRDELSVGRFDRNDAHTEIARERPLGGKLLVGQDVPMGDIVANTPIETS